MSKLDKFQPTTYSDNRFKTLDLDKIDDIIIGASCTHIFHLGFRYSEYVKSSKIIYKQGFETVLVKYPKDYKLEETPNGHTFLTVVLTPEETLKFRQTLLSTKVQMQVVNVDGETLYNIATNLLVRAPLDISYYKPDKFEKIKKYIYEASFNNLNYDDALNYLKSNEIESEVVSCSSMAVGGFFGRNLDISNNDICEFVVHVNGKYKSLGIAGGLPKLTEDFVSNFEYSDYYKLIPFFTYDGINEKGVFCSLSTVPGDDVVSAYDAYPAITQKQELSTSMVVRYVLDNFATAESAVEYLTKYCKIITNLEYRTANQALHFMLGDKNKTFVLEIINGRLVVLEDKNILTNFYLSDVNFNDDGTVYTPYDVQLDNNKPTINNGITLHGKGLERYNCLVNCLNTANTKQGMRDAMNSVRYGRYLEFIENDFTNCYPFFTEFIGEYYGRNGEASDHPYELTVDNSIDDYLNADSYVKVSEDESIYYDRILDYYRELYRAGKNGGAQYSVHSAVYDLNTAKLNVIFQEDDEELEFSL